MNMTAEEYRKLTRSEQLAFWSETSESIAQHFIRHTALYAEFRERMESFFRSLSKG
jgi:hypothetical protein